MRGHGEKLKIAQNFFAFFCQRFELINVTVPEIYFVVRRCICGDDSKTNPHRRARSSEEADKKGYGGVRSRIL